MGGGGRGRSFLKLNSLFLKLKEERAWKKTTNY